MKKRNLFIVGSLFFVGLGLIYSNSAEGTKRCVAEAYPVESAQLTRHSSLMGSFSICLPSEFERDWKVYGTLDHLFKYGSYAAFKNEELKTTVTIYDFYSPIPSKTLDFSSFDAYLESYKAYNDNPSATWDDGQVVLLKNGEKAYVSFGAIKSDIPQYAKLTTLHDGEAFEIYIYGTTWVGNNKDLIMAALLTYLP